MNTILFQKYINKTVLAIISFPKVNQKCIKILKWLHKILAFGYCSSLKPYIALFNFIGLTEMLDKFIKVLQILLNFSNCVSLVVTLKNLLILLPTKIIFTEHRRVHFYKVNLFIIVTTKIKVVAQKKGKSKFSHKCEE